MKLVTDGAPPFSTLFFGLFCVRAGKHAVSLAHELAHKIEDHGCLDLFLICFFGFS